MVFYTCVKFHENILNGFQITEWKLLFAMFKGQNDTGLWFLHSVYCLMMFYICVKFHQNIINGIKLQSGNCCLQCSKGYNSKIMQARVIVLALCVLFRDVLYLCKFYKNNHEWFSSYRAKTAIYNVQREITPTLYKPRGPKPNFRAFMPVLVTSNFDDDSIKNEWPSMGTPFSHYKSIGHFLHLKGS